MSKRMTPRFPEYRWYCVRCSSCLNGQADFNDNKSTWKCKECGHKNSISRDNLRKPYAYLEDDSLKNKVVTTISGTIRTIYDFVFRTAVYCFIAALIVIFSHKTTVNHLTLGLISPRGIEDYFCYALSCSGIVIIVLLVLYALKSRLFGRPDKKKHFIKETLYFIRDNLLHPINLLKALLFERKGFVNIILIIIKLVILVSTIAVLVYGCLNWL